MTRNGPAASRPSAAEAGTTAGDRAAEAGNAAEAGHAAEAGNAAEETTAEAGNAATPAPDAEDDDPTAGRDAETDAETDEGRDADLAPAPAYDPETAPWVGPRAWVFPALVATFGAIAVWGAFTIQAPPNTEPPGPGVVPGVVGTLLLVVAAWMAATNLRSARQLRGSGRAQLPGHVPPPPTDWPPVLLIVGTLAVHVALLETLGWLLAGALLFWGVAYAFGARSYARDALVAVSMSAAVQVGFSFGLGLSLPGGVLEWMV
ncbi:tripartite tricarboxylate transporter TctB family protein [Streptomyces sp. XM4193]|uniref:tripartite tricarboxylate transporter TctB family protein n=1 Tax=Streptomyces sp. XM4193 TaxID=2929782 RepID=UPI001FF9A751|nr:tripartite tricarboxylate transporter TctB family protein [Streptomyces sp. XM4193]MCK1795381.1 tripartite tricarboxylate transporter TctB family protein [Streptomyces sp. XM4193]